MGENRSVFSEEWRACLRAHYMYVLRSQDTVTEQTLRHVLLQTGMREDELDDLQQQAVGYDPAPAAEAQIDTSAEEIFEHNEIEQAAPSAEEPLNDLPEDDAPPPPAPGQLSMF